MIFGIPAFVLVVGFLVSTYLLLPAIVIAYSRYNDIAIWIFWNVIPGKYYTVKMPVNSRGIPDMSAVMNTWKPWLTANIGKEERDWGIKFRKHTFFVDDTPGLTATIKVKRKYVNTMTWFVLTNS